MSVRIGDHSEIGATYQSNTDKTGKYNSVREYSNYLTGKYGCLTPGKNASASITGGLLKKAMADLTQQFIMNFSPNLTELSTTSFDVRA